jgi:4-carboxymuconolactone decarboxylase
LAISHAARRNHDELFPGRASTLAPTDPELIAHFDSFAFDEVLRDSGLDARTRLMVLLASMIACQAVSEYRVMVGAALTVGGTPVEVKDVYQAVPYVGMAKVFDFLHATNDVLTDRGVELPLPGSPPPPRRPAWRRASRSRRRSLEPTASTRSTLPAPDDEQHIQRYLSANCFGDHLTRPGIDVPTRELLTLAMLVSLGGCEPQMVR